MTIINPDDDNSLFHMEELQNVFTTLDSQREFQMKAFRARTLDADNGGWVAQVNWDGFEEFETVLKAVQDIDADAPQNLANHGKKLKLAKEIRRPLTESKSVCSTCMAVFRRERAS